MQEKSNLLNIRTNIITTVKCIKFQVNNLKMATAMLQAYSMRNQPPMVFITNNGKGKDLKCLGYVYYKKQCNKKSWNYFCKSKNCNASISIRVGPEGQLEPIIATYLNIEDHQHEPMSLDESIENKFLKEVKILVIDND